MKNNTRQSTPKPNDASTVDGIGDAVAVRRFDNVDGIELTTEIVYAIAEARGVDPTDVSSPTLYERVDPVALQNLFFADSPNGADSNRKLTLEFPYEEFLIRVDSDGTITVFPG